MWTLTAHMIVSVACWGVVITSYLGKGGAQEQASVNETAYSAFNETYSNGTQPVAEPLVAKAFCFLHPGPCIKVVRKIGDIMFPEAPVEKKNSAHTAWPTTSGGSLWIIGASMLVMIWNKAKI